MILYHLIERVEWEAAGDPYRAPSLATEGFIHCSTATQYVEVANRFYGDAAELLLLFVDATALRDPVRLEPADGERFPHLYGPLPLDAVFEVAALERDPDGRFVENPETPALDAIGGWTAEEARRRAEQVMEGFDAPWWIAGGWAVDLALGRKTRPHADLEIAVRRLDTERLYEHLAGAWDAGIAHPSSGDHLEQWEPGAFPLERHQVWARPAQGRSLRWRDFLPDPGAVNFLIEEGTETEWSYRRAPAVTRPWDGYGRERVVAPATTLLYKAKGERHKDRRDARLLWPLLDDDEREWVTHAIATHHPGSPVLGASRDVEA